MYQLKNLRQRISENLDKLEAGYRAQIKGHWVQINLMRYGYSNLPVLEVRVTGLKTANKTFFIAYQGPKFSKISSIRINNEKIPEPYGKECEEKIDELLGLAAPGLEKKAKEREREKIQERREGEELLMQSREEGLEEVIRTMDKIIGG